MSMSVHKECGEYIKWARRPDDPERFYPPMEHAGEHYVLDDDGVAIAVHTYRPHRCDPAKVLAWQEFQQKLAEVREQQLNNPPDVSWSALAEQRREEVWASALTIDCPRCPALAGEKCINLSQHLQRTGELVETRAPHTQRSDLAYEPNKEQTDD